MRILNIKTVVTASVVATVVCILASCKGRTMDNMEPTGETVDVVIETPADTVVSEVETIAVPAADSISAE